MIYTIYDSATGQLLKVLTTVDPIQVSINLADQSYLAGKYSSKDYYIDQGQAVTKPADPSNGLTKYLFDYKQKQYVVDLDYTTIKTRNYRNNLLTEIDGVNPIRYASLTTEQQTELITYRQALLDVPQQMGFPTDISWPAKPLWL